MSTTSIEQLQKELEEEYRQLHQQAVLDAERSTELAQLATEETKKALYLPSTNPLLTLYWP